MLPKSEQKSYKNFLVSLTQLRDQVTVSDTNITKIAENFQAVQEIFQNQLLGLTTEELETSIIPSWQSIQTEIHRMLRLLGTDILFLQSSKRQETIQQRLDTIRDRTEQLIGYCQAIMR